MRDDPSAYNEERRLSALREADILDSEAESAFDETAQLAAQICETPIALVSLVDDHRQWFKACYGWEATETPRAHSFCTHALNQTDVLLVPDAAQDPRFAHSPLVTDEPCIRFYAGAPLVLEDGIVLGTLCVIDRRPRTLSPDKVKALEVLARRVVSEIDLRRKQKRLQRSQSFYQAFFEQLAVGVACIDLHGRWLTANQCFCSLLGYDREELLQRSVREVTHPDDQERDRRQALRALKGKIASYTLQQRYLHKDGRIVSASLAVTLLRDEDEQPLCFCCLIQDITAQKEAELSAEESQRRFLMLADSMPFIVWTADAEGRVDFASRELFEYTGISSEADPATRWQNALHPDDLESTLQTWSACIAEEKSYDIEFRLRRQQDEAYRWFHVRATPVRDSCGRIKRWYGTAIDIHDSKQVAHEARMLARRLTDTLESITDGFFILDQQWRITYINAIAKDVLRHKQSDLIGKVIWELFPEALGSAFEKQYRLAVEENRSVTFEEYFEPKRAWYEVYAYPTVEGLAVYFRDITERLEQRRQLSLSEERFRLLARATNDALWEWDLKNNSLWWNEGFETLFGFDHREVEPSLESWTSRIHPSDKDVVMEGVKKAMEDGRETWSSEYRFKRKDGSYAYVLDRGQFIRDSEGKVLRMIGGMSDMTVRRENEEKLREQAALLDNAQDAILVRDLEHHILYWNPSAERLYGWTAGEALGQSVEMLLYKDPVIFQAATRATLEKGQWVGEIEQYNKWGEKRIVEGHWTLMRDPQGSPKSVLAINTDITERKSLENQYLRAQRLENIGTLASGIAHDLNNLLAPIVMGVELLQRRTHDPNDSAIHDIIARSANRGASLVQQVLSFARGVEGLRITIKLSSVLKEMESIIQNTFPKNIEFSWQEDQNLHDIVGDPTQINQVLLNLCVNARDAMPDGGKLGIRAYNTEIDKQYAVFHRGMQAGSYVVLEVCDEGCGMSKEVQERIFEPFFTTKETGKGTGLGLPTILGIIRSHGGFINVYSEPQKGSVFKIYLPRKTEQMRLEEAHEIIDSAPHGHGECILVVDDEGSVLSITKQTLEAFGYKVLTAEDGAQAIGLFAQQREHIHLVLTDMMMPVMDGPALIAALRRLDKDIPIIAASGLSSNGHVAKASHMGVKYFLEKPYSADRLLLVIHQALQIERG